MVRPAQPGEKMTATQDDLIAELQRTVADLRRERDLALAQRNSAFAERIEQQAATIDVLQAMSASPDDAQPVFEAIVRRAQAFCEADVAAVALLRDGQLQLRAHVGLTGTGARTYEAAFPRPADNSTAMGRAILARDAVYITDLMADSNYGLKNVGAASAVRSSAAVPLLRDGVPIGAITIGRFTLGAYSDAQMALLKTFAEQAVIAIGSAETYRALQERTAALAARNSEYGERIEQQTATIDVLKVMSASPDNRQAVFDQMARRAQELCNGARVGLFEFDGKLVHIRTLYAPDRTSFPEYEAMFPMAPTPESITCRAILERRTIHVHDTDNEPGLSPVVRGLGTRSQISIPLMRDGAAIGAIALSAFDPGGFSDSQIALLHTFAEQAVIAITSAETYRELQDRTAALAERNDAFSERIEHQAATIDVLKAMSASPSDARPVFDLIIDRAKEFCEADGGAFVLVANDMLHLESYRGISGPSSDAYRALFPRPVDPTTLFGRSIAAREIMQTADMQSESELVGRQFARDFGQRSYVAVPVLRGSISIGALGLARTKSGGFSAAQLQLLTTFAEQAVIALTSAENYRNLQQRTAELTRSVAELQALEEVLRSVNASLDLGTVLETIISRAVALSQADEGMIYEYDEAEEVFIPRSAFGMTDDRIAGLRDARIRIGETYLGRSAQERAPVHVEDVQQDPSLARAGALLEGIHAVLAVPLLKQDKVIGGLVIRRRTEGGFPPSTVTLMQTFAGQSVLAIENARLFQELAARGEEARQARLAAENALTDLRRTQDRLVQTEKLASLGQLTAGIAHEIKNPLNFVNNFAELSVELVDEMGEALAADKLGLSAEQRADIDDLTALLKSNLRKIAEHGKRADSIVRNMLLHSRTGSGERRAADINALAEEALNLAYHGARAADQSFNITLEKNLDPNAGNADMYPQEFIRVLVNVIGNGFYAARKRGEHARPPGFEPILRLATRDLGDQVELRVRDNGTGIPDAVRDKIFEPFFTTKPAGEGTGLGLSLSYDIVVKQHGGQLHVDSQTDAFTEFVITLPRRAPRTVGDSGPAT